MSDSFYSKAPQIKLFDLQDINTDLKSGAKQIFMAVIE